MIRRVLWYLGFASLCYVQGCRCGGADAPRETPDAGGAQAHGTATLSPASAEATLSDRVSLLASLERCQFEHDGWVLDFGTPSEAASRDFAVTSDDGEGVVRRAGSTYQRMTSARSSRQFWIDQQQRGVVVRLKVFGAGASGVTVFIDGKRVGAARIQLGEIQTLRVGSSNAVLEPGRHEIMLHFWGRPPARRELPFAEIDWLQVSDGTDDVAGTYEAPTLHGAVVDREIAGQPKRSIALTGPATVRCLVQPSRDSRLDVALAFWGNGKGTAEVRIVSEGEPSVTLRQQKLNGGGDGWIPLQLDLGAFAGKAVGLELRALDSSPSGRVLFGEPALVRVDPERLAVPRADTVVLVVAAGLDRRRVPPYAKAGRLAALGALARFGTTYEFYRVPTTVSSGVLASMLTALPPETHKVQDQGARLPRGIKTLADVVKEAAGRTALFTGIPTAFAPFGFDSGWDRYEEFSPVRDMPVTEPLSNAVRWLQEHIEEREQPKLLVVLTRGAHPPWDVSKERASDLAPEDYAGPIDARRGGIILGKIRGRSRERSRRIDSSDWTRLHALAEASLASQVHELGRLLAVIERAEAWDRTLFIFAGDVGVGDAPHLPYHPAGPLTEDRLLTPLIVRFPKGVFSGKSVAAPTTASDVGATIAHALGIQFPTPREGIDLYAAAAGEGMLGGRTLLATLGAEYATRLGPWLLRGKLGRKPSLCRIDVDPACTSDHFNDAFYVAPALWQHTHDELAKAMRAEGPGREREPASIGPDTAAALIVWGDIP